MACKQSIQQGAEIARLLGKYVHQACKDQHLADIASRRRVTVLPDYSGGFQVREQNDEQVQRPHVGHTRGIRKIT
jgi:hypothetical protein